MRRLPFAGASFDAVLNLFNAFGYLEDEAQDELVLAEVARVLAPGGRFLQELANREAWCGTGTTAACSATTRSWSCSRNGPWTCAPAATWPAGP
jgi:SAM-dependent methyltransferase